MGRAFRFASPAVLLVAGLVFAFPGAGAGGGVTLGAPTLVGTPPAAGSGWTISTSGASHDFKPRPESKSDIRAKYSWKLPSSIPEAGAKGSITVTGSAADTDGAAPGITVSSSMVGCDGIKNATTPNSGCGTGTAQAALVLQPGQSGSSTQEFNLVGAPSTVTISFGGPQTVTFTYTGTYAATTGRTTTTTQNLGGCGGSTKGRRLQSAGAVQNEVRVVACTPDVQYHKGGSGPGAWLPVEKDTVLKQGDEITCDPDGSATLAFADNSTVTVRNTTQLKIASFFTEGGVVRTEILLRMGEVAAQVNKSEATKSDFRIKTPSFGAGVRGGVLMRNGSSTSSYVDATATAATSFSAFYDPVSNIGVWSVTRGEIEITPPGGKPPVILRAGQEVQVTRAGVGKPAPIGKAGARGGIDIVKARDLVMKTIARYNGPCGLVTPRTGAFSVKPSGAGWLVSVKAIAGKAKGWSTWQVAGSKVTPQNAAAKKIAAGCR